MLPPNKFSDDAARQSKTPLRGGGSISKMLVSNYENLSLDPQHSKVRYSVVGNL